MRFLSKSVLCIVPFVLGGLIFGGAAGGAENPEFTRWIAKFYPEARKEGISSATWRKAFAGVTEPDPAVLAKASYQPEFTTEIWDYLDGRVNSLSIGKGEKMGRYHERTLAEVERKFGVERAVLLAIWSMESNYGAIFEKPDRLYYVPLALATLAYGDPKRQKYGRTQLLAALKILQDGDIAKEQLNGSWAGAMGHTQFIPTSYLAYGVDMDGNGRRDIWNSIPDALATAANLLQENGWRTGRTWGYEIVLPAKSATPLKWALVNEETKTLAEWQKLGCRRPGGQTFARPDDKAVLKLFAGDRGPAFLVLKNFYVLKRYNNSDFYALAVGLLADRLAGGSGLVQSWPRPAGSLTGEERLELQQRLQQGGYYSGEVDGHVGEGTMAAIRRFQTEVGLTEDGLPTQGLLQLLRKR